MDKQSKKEQMLQKIREQKEKNKEVSGRVLKGTRLTFDIHPDLHREFKEVCFKNHTTQRKALMSLIQRFVETSE